MNQLQKVFSFGWPYLRRYQGRLLCAVLCGMLFGLANGSFLWAIRTLMTRLTPTSEQTDRATAKADKFDVTGRVESLAPGVKEQLATVRTAAADFVDKWLPMSGVKMDWRQIVGVLLLLPLLALFRSSADYLASYCMGWVSERVVNDLRADVLEKLSSLSLDYFNRSTAGDMLTRINTDTLNLQRTLRAGCAELVKEPFAVIAALGAMFWIDPSLTLFVLVFLPVCLFPLILLGRKARCAGRSARKASVGQNSMLVELLTGIRVIKAFTLEARELERFRTFAKQIVRHSMKGVQAKELTNPLLEVIMMFGLGALILFVFVKDLEVPDLVAFLTAMIWFYVPVKKLASIHMLFEQAAAGVERLIEIRGEQPTVREPAVSRTLEGFQREIRFERVEFDYGRGGFTLHDFHFVIPRGLRLGVAGESGSGKSTIANLLFRFYDPTQGRITLDGVDLREFSFVELRRHMALVSQDIFLFDMTVAENIASGRPGATREEIEQAARAAYAHEFICRLPEEYDTQIGERGVTLSGGQRQRLCIARAFVRNAPILVLDEATGSLDSQAEAEVQAAIDRLAENRTVISIAHRLSTLTNMDEIIVIADGRISERGTFQELLSSGGQFADMARKQGISSTPGSGGKSSAP